MANYSPSSNATYLPMMPEKRISILTKNARAFAWSLLVLYAIGCGDNAETLISVSPADLAPDETKSSGQVVLADPDATTAGAWGTDDFELSAAAITGDTLAVTVSYAGGCREHLFTLVSSSEFKESNPVQVVDLAHNAQGDSCEAWITRDYLLNLTPLKVRYQEAYQQEEGAIVLLLKDAPEDLVYDFAQ